MRFLSSNIKRATWPFFKRNVNFNSKINYSSDYSITIKSKLQWHFFHLYITQIENCNYRIVTKNGEKVYNRNDVFLRKKNERNTFGSDILFLI